jgi:hypothetical protein
VRAISSACSNISARYRLRRQLNLMPTGPGRDCPSRATSDASEIIVIGGANIASVATFVSRTDQSLPQGGRAWHGDNCRCE